MTGQSDTLSIRFTPTEASVRAGMLAAQKLVLMAIFMAVMFGGGMAVLQAGGLDWSSPEAVRGWAVSHTVMGVVFGVLGGLGLRHLLIPMLARSVFRQNPAFYGPTLLDLDEDGLTLAAPKSTTRLGWADIRGYKAAHGALAISLSKTAWFAVPLDQLTEPEQAALRARLAARLPELAASRRKA